MGTDEECEPNQSDSTAIEDSVTQIMSNLRQLQTLPRKIQKQSKIKIDLTKTQYPLLRIVATQEIGWRLWCRNQTKEQANILWVDTYVTDKQIRKMKPYQRINHFPNSFQLGKKNCLCNNLNRMRRTCSQYNFYPLSWHLPNDYNDLAKFMQENPNRWFIAKPVADSQGRGIYLMKQIENIQQECVVQEYVQSPLLIDNKKFDLRIYVLIRSLFPLKIYIFREGLARLATSDYEQPTPMNLKNVKMHLTNYAINKQSPNYIFNRDENQDNIGHKRSYTAVMQEITRQGCDISKLQQHIDAIVIKTILSAYQKLSEAYRNLRNIKEEGDSVCFEVLGFDIMIQSDFTPVLIQVNHSPSFCTDTPLDLAIKKYLLLDTLNMVNVSHQNKLMFLKSKMPSTDQEMTATGHRMSISFDRVRAESCEGGYRRIYPLEDKSTEKSLFGNEVLGQLLKRSQKCHKQIMKFNSRRRISKAVHKTKPSQAIFKLPAELLPPIEDIKSSLQLPVSAKEQFTYSLYNVLNYHQKMQHKTPIAYPSSRLTDHHTEMSLAERNKLEEDKLRAMSRRKQNFLLMPVKNIDISFNEDSHKGQKNSFSVLKGHPHEYKISVYLKTLHKFNPQDERRRISETEQIRSEQSTVPKQSRKHLDCPKQPPVPKQLFFTQRLHNTNNRERLKQLYQSQMKAKIEEMQLGRRNLQNIQKDGGRIIIRSRLIENRLRGSLLIHDSRE